MVGDTWEPSEPIGQHVSFREWADEVMSQMETRQRRVIEASSLSAARDQRSAELRSAMTRRLLSWLSGSGA